MNLFILAASLESKRLIAFGFIGFVVILALVGLTMVAFSMIANKRYRSTDLPSLPGVDDASVLNAPAAPAAADQSHHMGGVVDPVGDDDDDPFDLDDYDDDDDELIANDEQLRSASTMLKKIKKSQAVEDSPAPDKKGLFRRS